jgi:hypothetical protein
VGTYVLVYNGFGGKLPDVYREVKSEHDLPNVMRLWRKARPSASRRPSGARALGRGNGGEGMCLQAPLGPLGVAGAQPEALTCVLRQSRSRLGTSGSRRSSR